MKKSGTKSKQTFGKQLSLKSFFTPKAENKVVAEKSVDVRDVSVKETAQLPAPEVPDPRPEKRYPSDDEEEMIIIQPKRRVLSISIDDEIIDENMDPQVKSANPSESIGASPAIFGTPSARAIDLSNFNASSPLTIKTPASMGLV